MDIFTDLQFHVPVSKVVALVTDRCAFVGVNKKTTHVQIYVGIQEMSLWCVWSCRCEKFKRSVKGSNHSVSLKVSKRSRVPNSLNDPCHALSETDPFRIKVCFYAVRFQLKMFIVSLSSHPGDGKTYNVSTKWLDRFLIWTDGCSVPDCSDLLLLWRAELACKSRSLPSLVWVILVFVCLDQPQGNSFSDSRVLFAFHTQHASFMLLSLFPVFS